MPSAPQTEPRVFRTHKPATIGPAHSKICLMKKEIIFAVVIGLIVGLIITFGMYRARQSLSGSSTENARIEGTLASPPTASVQPSSTADAFLVSEPADESLITDPQIRVSGQAFPNAAIAILTGNGEVVGTADAKGNFSLAVTLQPGANIITIRALGNTREPLEVIRTVVVSNADLSATPSAVPKPTATPSPTKKPRATPKT